MKGVIGGTTIFLVIIAVAGTMIVGWVFFNQAQDAMVERTLDQLESVAAVQESRVDEYATNHLDKFSLIAENDIFVSSLLTDRINSRIFLENAKDSVEDYIDLIVTDSEGKIVLSTGTLREGDFLQNRIWYTEGQFVNGFYIEDFEPDNPRIYISGPIKQGETLVGVLIIITDSHSLLDITLDYTGLGNTGETMLIQKSLEGDGIIFSPLRFEFSTGKTNFISRHDSGNPAIQALRGSENRFENLDDYKGSKVLSATRLVDLTGWGIVVKMDTQEAFVPLEILKDWARVLVLIGLILVAILTMISTIIIYSFITKTGRE